MQIPIDSIKKLQIFRKFIKELSSIESNLQIKGKLKRIVPHYFLFISKPTMLSECHDFKHFLNSFMFSMETKNTIQFGDIFKLNSQDTQDLKKILEDNEAWSQIVSFFTSYRWSVSEFDENKDSESITPEILEYLHEQNVKDGKIKGIFYTPRIIGKYMCRKALYYYFQSVLPELKEELKPYFTGSLFDRQINEKSFSKLIDSKIEESAIKKVLRELEKIRILDNACGTGIFLITMLHECYQLLLLFQLDSDSLPNLLKSFISKSLYGVDIDEDAVKITKKRLWVAAYSLLLEKFGSKTSEILGINNEDFNIEVGNSIFGSFFDINQEMGHMDEENRENQKEYERFNIYFFNKFIKNANSKISYDEYLNLKPFHWSLKFPQINKEGGFNIVIGNPPYIKEYDNRTIFNALKKSPYYQGKMDIWYFFACSALDLLRTDGILCYIAQNNWITNFGAKKMRSKIKETARLLEFVDFHETKIFGKAEIQTMIMLLKKETNKVPTQYPVLLKKIKDNVISDQTFLEFLHTHENINKKEFQIENVLLNCNGTKDQDDAFRFSDKFLEEIFSYIISRPNIQYLSPEEIGNGCDPHQYKLSRENMKKLQEIYPNNPYRFNEGIFVLTNEEMQKIPWTEQELKEIIKPFYTSEEFDRYFIKSPNKYWIIYTRSDANRIIEQYPHVKAHLDRFKEIITSDNKPYGLHRARKQHLFEGKKIFSLRKTEFPSFTYSECSTYVGQSFNIIQPKTIDYFYLLGILNSKLIAFWLKHKGKMQGKNYQVDVEPLVSIPIITISEKRDLISFLTEFIVKSRIISPFSELIDYLVFENYFYHYFYTTGLNNSEERLLSQTILEKLESHIPNILSVELSDSDEIFRIKNIIVQILEEIEVKKIIEKIKQNVWIQRILKILEID